jgi:hypothetical protein
MGELSILSAGLPGEGSQAPLRSTCPITGRLTDVSLSLEFRPIIVISVVDPGSGAFWTPGSGIRNRFLPGSLIPEFFNSL